MLSAAKPAVCPSPLRVLLVGDKEEDFFLIREILGRTEKILPSELAHAHSVEEAEDMVRAGAYGLILFEHDSGTADAVHLLTRLLHEGRPIPFIILTEDADENAVAGIIAQGRWNCLAKSQLDGATLIRTIHSTLKIQALEDKQEAAEDSLRKLSRAVEQSADTIVITDCAGHIEYVNPAFEALTGFTRDEVRGKSPRILKSGEQAPEVYQEMWKTILSGNVFRGILVNRKKNGDLYYVEESICPIRNSEGRITHFVSNGRDLTERVRLEAQLLQAQKMDAIGRLAGGVAHDFNNLLTIITSYSELALDEVPGDASVGSKIREILLAARRAAELTRQLLAFSRKQPRAPRIADLNEVIGSVAKTIPRLIGEDIEFSFQPGESLGRVRIDPLQIEQVLMNLASNARDAMPEGGELRIETSSEIIDEGYVTEKPAVIPLGKYALITVSDNGTGIPQEHLPHIFEPFFTTKRPGEGTGLGLATVYGIVKQNKGFIWAYSEPGMGSTFKIYLPTVSTNQVDIENLEGKDTPHVRGTETILLVEDEAAVRKASAEFLRLNGYTVLEAKDGIDALAIVKGRNAPIPLIITDVVMPKMSGGQLAKEILRLRPETRMLFVSGYAGRTVLDHKVFDLERSFLQKPYTLKQLSAKIRAALDHRGNERNSAPGYPCV
ncbi:MAG TPA: PAS domain S-box protein [Candidatus Sulfotelmatobacter sp.]|nr:PAS domain S-box protein [Candidatus Sulfotelmatobacter sp.]